MPVGKCMKELSYRQYLVMTAWFRNKWNEPSLTDQYLMRIAQRIQQVLADNPKKITMEDQKIDFVFKAKPMVNVLSSEEKQKRLEINKSIWKAAVGYGVKNVKRSRS